MRWTILYARACLPKAKSPLAPPMASTWTRVGSLQSRDVIGMIDEVIARWKALLTRRKSEVSHPVTHFQSQSSSATVRSTQPKHSGSKTVGSVQAFNTYSMLRRLQFHTFTSELQSAISFSIAGLLVNTHDRLSVQRTSERGAHFIPAAFQQFLRTH
eukprot:SAG31_NODE_4009_length_3668_cov_17.056598_3_plen_157_part_00